MAVLPPTEESTWASSVVGICTKSIPRLQIAAAKPGQVADHAAAERDDQVAAVELQRQQRVAELPPGRRSSWPPRPAAMTTAGRRSPAALSERRPARAPCRALTVSSMTTASAGPLQQRPRCSAPAWSIRPAADQHLVGPPAPGRRRSVAPVTAAPPPRSASAFEDGVDGDLVRRVAGLDRDVGLGVDRVAVAGLGGEHVERVLAGQQRAVVLAADAAGQHLDVGLQPDRDRLRLDQRAGLRRA